jgi:hypothetical protein
MDAIDQYNEIAKVVPVKLQELDQGRTLLVTNTANGKAAYLRLRGESTKTLEELIAELS